MNFTSTQITFLQSLIEGAPASKLATATALFFSEHFSIGRAVAGAVSYSAEHHAAAEDLLRAHRLPVASLGKTASRAEAASFGGMSEKAFSVAPRARSVAIRCIGDCKLDGQSVYTPDGTHMVTNPERASTISCDRIMLVENFETFQQVQAYRWIEWDAAGTLVVYRGDPENPNQHAAQLVLARGEPVVGFFDFDPAGLMMAKAIPSSRFKGFVLPDQAWLGAACDTPHGRQLYDRQVGVYGAALDATSEPLIIERWAFMKSLASAVAQEAMRSA
ncbi:hypothetical protein J7E62_05925 [Variovorax paradoxus]|nr:hypothetical protein [Variovorax paradoxus]